MRSKKIMESMAATLKSIVETPPVFTVDEESNEIIENIEEDSDKILVSLVDLKSDGTSFETIVNGVALPVDLISIYNDGVSNKAAFYFSASDDGMEPEMEIELMPYSYIKIECENPEEEYHINVKQIPPHLRGIAKSSDIMDLFPILDTVNAVNTVANQLYYITEIYAYPNPMHMDPVLFDTVFTPVSKPYATHLSKVNERLCEYHDLDTLSLTNGSIIVVNTDSSSQLMKVDTLNSGVVSCHFVLAEAIPNILKYSSLKEDYCHILDPYTTIFARDPDTRKLSIIECTKNESSPKLNDANKFVAGIDAFEALNKDAISEVCNRKLSGHRIDTKRNKVVLGLVSAYKVIKEAVRASNNFKELYVYDGCDNILRCYPSATMVDRFEALKETLKVIGVDI